MIAFPIGSRALLATIGGFIGLFLVLKPSALSEQDHSRYTESLTRLAEINAELNVHVLKARQPDPHNYDALSALAAELETMRRHAEQLPRALDRQPQAELQILAQELSNGVARKRELITKFKSFNAVLKNSRTWLLKSTRDGSYGVHSGNRPGADLLVRMERGVLELLLHPGGPTESTSLAAIEQDLGAMRNEAESLVLEPAQRQYLQVLDLHAQTSFERLPVVRKLVDEAIALPIARQAENLLKLYSFHYNKARDRVAYGRILASLLMLFSAYQLLNTVVASNRDRSALRQKVATRERQLEVELEERKSAEETLRQVASLVSGESDPAFFQTLVDGITLSLGLEYAMIGRLDENDPDRIISLAVSRRGQPIDNTCYSLEDAPCANVVGRQLCCYPREVGSLFPKDQMLIDMGVESYCGAPFFDSKGRPTGLIAAMDTRPFEKVELIESVVRISSARVANELERNSTEEAIRAEKERFAVTLRSIGDGIIATDLDGNVMLINREAERLTGWSQAEAEGRGLSEVFEIVDLSSGRPYEDLIRKVVETGRLLVLSETYRLMHKDGTSCLITDSCAPIFDAENKILGAIVVFRDITERKQVEAEKTKIEGQLLQLQKMETIGTLAAGIAHEFNNLLAPIVGYASLCLELIPSTEKTHRHVDRILSSAMRAKKLVSQILKFGHQHTLEYQLVPLQRTLEDAAELIRSVAPSTISIRVDAPDDLAPVLCDENQIHQVLINLCTNAYLSMQTDGGVLELSMDNSYGALGQNQAEHEFLTIMISDTGCGIPLGIRERIFDPFFSTRGIGEGTGLGLSVALGIVKSHGGSITVNSEVGEGTTFEIHLPVVVDVAQLETPTPRVLPEITTRGGRILFVDDEVEILELAEALLGQHYGFEIVSVNNSHQAWLRFQEAPQEFDLVITDHTMPGMKGFELGRRMLAVRPDLPVLLITGYSQELTEEGVIADGFAGLVMKPIIGQELRAAVHDALEGTAAG